MTEQASAAGRVVLVTGMSGAGRTTALKVMEDMGYEAVDNLPLRLLNNLVRQGPAPGRGLAIGVDVRTRGFHVDPFIEDVSRLRAESGNPVDLLFIDCDDEVLRRRYTETRRIHPLGEDRRVTDGIAREREILTPLRNAADVVIDTSHTNVHAFTQTLRQRLGGQTNSDLQLFVTSFAFRDGLPRDADLVFDVRFLRNPHYEPELRAQTGCDPAVGDFVSADEGYEAFFSALTGLLALLLPRYDREGKRYLTLAIGCTGGQHRSVYVAEQIASWLRQRGLAVDVLHRELERGDNN